MKVKLTLKNGKVEVFKCSGIVFNGESISFGPDKPIYPLYGISRILILDK